MKETKKIFDNKLKKPRTQEEQDALYEKTWDYDPDEEEVDEKYSKEFDEWLMADELI